MPLRSAALAALAGATIAACAPAEGAPAPRPSARLSAAQREDVRRAAALLDYLAADYGGAVRDGHVLDGEELEEQFAMLAETRTRLLRLPAASGIDVVAELRAVRALVAAKAPGSRVAAASHTLRARLLGAYEVALAPSGPLSFERGAALFATRCAGCHGAGGAGDGPRGRGLRPAPRNLRDRASRAGLSAARAFAAVTYGVRETAMPAFALLGAPERWDLAFFVLALGHEDEAARARGKLAFARVRGLVAASAIALSGVDDASLAAALAAAGLDAEDAGDALAFLRADAAFAGTDAPFDGARRLVAAALAAYHDDDAHAARQLVRNVRDAGSGALPSRDRALAARLDEGAERLEAQLTRAVGSDDEVVDQAGLALSSLYDLADQRLADPARARAAFVRGLSTAAVLVAAALFGLGGLAAAARRIVLSAAAPRRSRRRASDAAPPDRAARSAPDRSASAG